MKESTKESENMFRAKCKEDRKREKGKSRKSSNIAFNSCLSKKEIFNYILSLRTRDGIMSEAVTGCTPVLSSARLSLCSHHYSSFLII
jgi:hypothetical protein